jgi:transposase
MNAIHGGKATNDRIHAQKIAILLRGGMVPQPYVYPAEMRATRDLLARRLHLTRTRAELLTQIQQTNWQDNLPEMGKKITYKANRVGVAARFAEPAVYKSVEVDLALIDFYDQWLRNVELTIVQTATQHDAPTVDRLPSVPGIGKMLRGVLLDALHAIPCFPRVQDVVTYGRLVKCAQQSAGKRSGTAGTKLGHASLPWAFSEAAVLVLRHHPVGQTERRRLEKKHGQGNAFTVWPINEPVRCIPS